VREVAALDDRLSAEVLNLAIDRDRAEAYGVTRVPAIVVEGARDYGLRFFGIPSGYDSRTSSTRSSWRRRRARAERRDEDGARGAHRGRPHPVFSTPT
jgi:hypothetical protein